MGTRLISNTHPEVASVACAAGVALVGAWLLVLAAGTVAIFAVVIVAGLAAPMRWRRTPRNHATAD